MTAELEIAALRMTEDRMQKASEEGDRLIRSLVPVYVCDFVIAEIPDGIWVPLPRGWQAGIKNPIPPRNGKPPRDYKGAVAVSINTLRRIAL